MTSADRTVSQPARLAWAPPSYPEQAVGETGLVAAVRLERVVGFVVRQGDALTWWGRWDEPREPEEDTVAEIAWQSLRDSAARGDSVDVAWSTVLAKVLHDPPAEVASLEPVAAMLR